MEGGWDAAAWRKQGVNKGLPANGELAFTLQVSAVAHAAG